MRLADAVLHADMQINWGGQTGRRMHPSARRTSSIRLSLTWPAPLCTMKTSFPRTDSPISTRVSPTANLDSSLFAGGTPRWSHICSTER
jgi:hypothetical protein